MEKTSPQAPYPAQDPPRSKSGTPQNLHPTPLRPSSHHHPPEKHPGPAPRPHLTARDPWPPAPGPRHRVSRPLDRGSQWFAQPRSAPPHRPRAPGPAPRPRLQLRAPGHRPRALPAGQLAEVPRRAAAHPSGLHSHRPSPPLPSAPPRPSPALRARPEARGGGGGRVAGGDAAGPALSISSFCLGFSNLAASLTTHGGLRFPASSDPGGVCFPF